MGRSGIINYVKKLSQKNRFEDIYEVVRLIPVGRVTSYRAIAAYLGSPRGARMVGWALNLSHGQSDIPAHRVVNAQGILSGKHFFGSATAMQERLEAEGVTIDKDQVVEFATLFWDPTLELS